MKAWKEHANGQRREIKAPLEHDNPARRYLEQSDDDVRVYELAEVTANGEYVYRYVNTERKLT